MNHTNEAAKFQEAKFQELVEAACSDQITDQQVLQLEEFLSNDRLACEYYLFYCRMHSSLQVVVSAQRAESAALAAIDLAGITTDFSTNFSTKQLNLPADVASTLDFLTNQTNQQQRFWTKPSFLSFTFAAFFIGCVLTTLSFLYLGHNKNNNKLAEVPEEKIALKQKEVAWVSATDNCQWSDGSKKHFQSDSLYQGDLLDLVKGNVEITFGNQATVQLRGPIQFRVDSTISGTLIKGRVLVHAAIPARGFFIETSAAKIIDLGTKFIAEVDQRETTEIQVVEGSVEVGAKDAEGDVTSQKKILLAGQAMRVKRLGPLQIIEPKTDSQTVNAFLGKPKRLKVLAHFRLGEAHQDAENGQLVKQDLIDLSGKHRLKRYGIPKYAKKRDDSPSPMAIVFDGTKKDHFRVDQVITTETDNWVLEAWVRVSEKHQGRFVYNGDSHGSGYGMGVDGNEWVIYQSGSGGGWLHFGAKFKYGEWTHVAAVRENGETHFYMNGKKQGRSYQNTPAVPKGFFMIGGQVVTPNRQFKGEVDEVRLSLIKGRFNPRELLYHIR